MTGMAPVAFSLAKREFTRFIRQPQRVAGTVAQPLLFWLFLGAGFGGSFRPAGMENVTYLEYFYPGVMLMMMLFASIFSSITIIEDRDAGFLQGVLVAPVSRLAIVLGKVLGATSIAMIQTLIFTIAAPFLGLHLGAGALVLLLMGFLLTGIGFSALGFLLAWGMKSTSAFHAVMMVFLMPLWMLSGALFPIGNVPGWMKAVMLANPVSHALVIIRAPFYGGPERLFTDTHYLVSLAVTLAWAGICLGLSMARVNRREKGV
ncbi:ABC-type multidrug transport system permease component [Paramagnetospirillum magnetotacticum MS-1]|uniref:Transport permease protein n=1 Tax=Paramagnetospirillum magnetotacticum MS-1 TaxID=272627 RepID=A0A0C2V2E2_PARME|nr:ABC transporter permease [Paramagnetospirillum magnetotacticum]KIL99241.1 ABC-type multidrug transport system permease component [Paramagnetospirillum magnetotacticum MS-1]